MESIEIPVLIVGGGGCGLCLSILCADYGVAALAVERNQTTTDHPRAHILNQRTMEIFRQHGLADEVYRQGTPAAMMERISFRTSLGGDGPLDRRLIGDIDGYGGGALRVRYEADSACRATNLPLMQREPLLRSVAEARAPGSVRFHHELLRLPGIELKIHKIGRWDVEGVVARRYREGRALLAGDAAHRHPPVSAPGLNTAFGDAHNLVWKRALVLSGKASDAIPKPPESPRHAASRRAVAFP